MPRAPPRYAVELNASKGWDLRMHIDAASGGFVAPFVWPELRWDFRLPTVASINVSGHKYGLVYPGLGWAIWRDAQHLPEDLVSASQLARAGGGGVLCTCRATRPLPPPPAARRCSGGPCPLVPASCG